MLKNLGSTRLITLVLTSALTLIAVACSSPGGEVGSKSTDFDINTYQSGGVREGQQSSLDAVLGQGKPVVLNFWAGDCPPCKAEMPEFEQVWQDYRDDVVILGVDIGPFVGLGTYQQASDLLTELEVTYPAGNSEDGGIVNRYNIAGLPTTLFLTPDGTITERDFQALSRAQLARRVDRLLDTSEAS